jgi:choline dehydrogenase-like flavoprotein
LQPCFWQYARSPDRSIEFMRFGAEFLKLDAPNIRVLDHATVSDIDAGPNGRRLRSLEVTCAPGKTITVTPRVAVLCAGAIENARLLLASNRTNPRGVGNDNDLVGRFLMDHPRTTLGEFTADAARAVQSRFGLLRLRHNGATHVYTHGLALSAELQREERLLNCAAFLTEHRAADDPWDALKRLCTRRSAHPLKDAMAVACAPGLLLEGARLRWIAGRNVAHKLDRLAIDCLVEQVPDPESRLTLSDKRDALGMPIARLHWRVSDQERRSVTRLAELFACEMRRLGLEPPKLARWVRESRPDLATFRDVAHPAGTTRMADDATQGVVDRNCQVHGVDGVYIAGSSVFPTAGHANPTLMIVAMALRLADWLKERHFQSAGLSAPRRSPALVR